ncbi:sortilin-like [Acipenser oxyrinchus oxyrinchus]|uniref:Sortilin n=1 Tax=Acipenser oxyrinchus oxyrinchus TaxID=40147 RepID=A0AAD8CJM6_ACIOX|nr:sortilin-like [Acipenser oxyrinchus oxyrinchus]
MPLVLNCCVLLLVCICTLSCGLDDRDRGNPVGSSFVKTRRKILHVLDSAVIEGSAPDPSASALHHYNKVNKRSTELGDTCNDWKGFEDRLTNNTHPFPFFDLSGSVSLAWVGDGTGVVLALTTFQVPLLLVKFGQSKLYRSENYGKSFSDVSGLINNTFIRTEFGIAIGPENSGKVILTGDVSGGSAGGRIFRSLDFGNRFSRTDLPFHPLTQITYNPRNASQLLVLGVNYDLWLSLDFGETWKMMHDTVCLVKWGPKNTIFFTTYPNGSCIDRGMLELRKTSDFGKSFRTIGTKIYSFGLGGKFIFASVMTGSGTVRVIHVSVDQGESWNMAQLPPVGHEQFYSILAANDDVVFMHVDEPGDTGFGTIFVSDDRGIVYSKSLERHLYTMTSGDTDFTNVTSLRGVYMTSVLAEDGSVQTVITFDQGGEWKPIRKPENSQCDSTAKNKEMCSLHIHASYSISQKLNVPMPPLSEPNAVGLIIAHGSVGDAISVMTPDVYVSDDGGYSWIKALVGPHHYAILDSGGLIVAVEHSPSQPIKHIKFSTDEGQCWYRYNFTTDLLYFTGLASEPGARSMNVSVWGYRETLITQYWVSITIDFNELLTRDCDEKDYVQWLAHSNDLSDPNDGCMLGYKEQFLRLRKASVCWNGRDYIVNKQPSTCPCTLDDFLCDFGYFRPENRSECLEQPDLKGHDLEFCLHGTEELLQTSGYRKIPGDRCESGTLPERKVIDLRKKCVSNLLDPAQPATTPSTSPAPIVAAVIGVLAITIIAGVLLVKKYVCGGRFLVHRYSVLQQHAEANGIEGVDELETNSAQSSRRDYHDDSDEDLLE